MSKKISSSKLLSEKKTQTVLGVWDQRFAPLSVGGLLTFIEELQTQNVVHKTSEAELCFTGGVNPLTKEGTFLPLLEGIAGIREFFWKESLQRLMESTIISNRPTWPDVWSEGAFPHAYDSTLAIQMFFEQQRFIPHLSCRPVVVDWAKHFLKKHVSKAATVVVHLKNNQEAKDGNANLPAWEKFFARCRGQFPVKFILIGNEKIPQSMKRLENVIVTQGLKSNLVRDLALIQQADIFMGMSSGPCNMAIFSAVPYVIFKNPQHHAEEMNKELGDKERFNFSSPTQKFLRVRETEQRLMLEFQSVYKKINKG